MKSILEKTPSLLGMCLPKKSVRIVMHHRVPLLTMPAALLRREAVHLKLSFCGFSQGVGRKDVHGLRDKLGKPKASTDVLSRSSRAGCC